MYHETILVEVILQIVTKKYATHLITRKFVFLVSTILQVQEEI